MSSGRRVIVTDSTASLPAELAAERGVVVVPLQVVIGATVYDEGVEGGATPELVAASLKEWTPVSTSRPAPAVFVEIYERLAAEGATEILSVHLSAEMSGTFESAQLAAREMTTRERSGDGPPVRVVPVDTRQVGPGTGFAVLAAADVLGAGGSVDEAAEAALRRAEATTSLFYVDTLEYLRRGGRIGAAAALFGGALAVKPLLRIDEGRIASYEKVRTSGRALSRLEDLAVEAAGDDQVDVGVYHLASPERAGHLCSRLTERLDYNLAGRDVGCGELGAVLGAHVGPGMVAVCVAPRF
ncbi:DegV family protein [Nocardioides pacificus]